MEVLLALLESPQLCGLPPVVAMTGNASPQDQERYAAAGFLETMGKPFTNKDLTRVLAYAACIRTQQSELHLL